METTALARPNSQKQPAQSNRFTAGSQAESNAGTVLARLQNYNFGMSEGLALSLQNNGISSEMLPMVVSTCVAAGVSPALLAYRHNIPAVVRVMNQVKELGYRAGEDFYTTVFSSKTPIMNEYGEPTSEKVSAPTLVVMPSATRAIENMRQEDRLNGGLYHHFESGALEGDEAKAAFDSSIGNSAPFQGAVVGYVDMYTYMNGKLLGSGKPQRFFGFFLPFKFYNGKAERDNLELAKVMSNYTPLDIAIKRATVKAARSVTRTNYARDNRSPEERLATLTQRALTVLGEVEHRARAQGVSLDQAFDREDAPVVDIAASAMMADRKTVKVEEDGDILFSVTPVVGHRPVMQDPDKDVAVTEFEDDPLDIGSESDDPTVIAFDTADKPVKDFVDTLRAWFNDPNGLDSTEGQKKFAIRCVELVVGAGNFSVFYEWALAHPMPPEGYPYLPLKLSKFFYKLPTKSNQKQDDGSYVQVDNASYDGDAVTMVSAVWDHIKTIV